MILCIIGSRRFTQWWGPHAAEGIIRHVLAKRADEIEVVISGGADGIDTLALDIAEEMKLPVEEFLPDVRDWAAPGGFRDRNRRMAEECTDLLCVRASAGRTYGSGWTADYAESIGRHVVRVEF
jgi:predicted Rossmann fold nucleotide-binding protein DprA/Smf involved in DNA uptake